MFTTSSQLQDAKANSKIFFILSLVGALAGAAAGPAVYFKQLPEEAQRVVTPSYIINFNAARVPAFSNQFWAQTRAGAYKKVPGIAAQLDNFPAAAAAGAAAGALCLPLSLGMLISATRRSKTPKQGNKKKKSVSDFLPK